VLGIELTAALPLNHQNAFPLLFKPHLQDGWAADPPAKTRNASSGWRSGTARAKARAANHSRYRLAVLSTATATASPTGGFKKEHPFHRRHRSSPLEWLLKGPLVEVPDAGSKQVRLENNRIFQLSTIDHQGTRITGRGEHRSHYNFHERLLRNTSSRPRRPGQDPNA